jgi:zinc protease
MRALVLATLVLAVGCAGPPAPTRAPNVVAPTASARPKPPTDEAWRNAVPTPDSARPLSYPAADVSKLASGLTVAVIRRPAGVATLELVVRHGQSSVPAGKSGLAALTARMLTEGTRDKDTFALAEAVEALGTSLEHDAGRDDSTLSMTTLLSDVPRGLELLAEVVQRPAFSEKDFERVKREWIDGLVQERQTPSRVASLAGLRLVLGAERGAPVGGSVPDVEKLRRADLVAFHRARYVPSECAVIVAGDIDPAEAKKAVEAAFGAWKAAKPVPTPKPKGTPGAKSSQVVLVDRPGSVQSAIFAGQELPPRSAPGHEARSLMSDVVGGLFTSRINKNLREEHAYTYGARSSVAATRSWGAFVVQTSVESAVTADALKELFIELRRASDPSLGAPISDEEVSRARADLTTSLGAHLEQTGQMADDYATTFVQALAPTYFSTFGSTLLGIDSHAVAKEAARLDPDHMTVVIVGDAKSVHPLLEKQGYSVVAAPAALTE